MNAVANLRCPIKVQEFPDRLTDAHLIKEERIKMEMAESLLPVKLRSGAQGYLTYPDVNPSSVSRTDVNAFKGAYLFTKFAYSLINSKEQCP